MRVLIIGSVWVEPTSTAAGSRMLQLLELFLEQGWELTFATTAGPSEHAFDLESLGIRVATIQLNDVTFDTFAKTLSPQLVLFDRFMTEEQFGWRIAEQCPDALRILDTEDLHCLRKARELAVKEQRPYTQQDLISDVAKREIASIYRSDLTLMISTVEMKLLQNFFKVPENLLWYLPFLLERLDANFIPFEDRIHFMSIGNFLHTPNWDATVQLKQHIWPLIRKELPKAELQVFGAYPSEKVKQLDNAKEGFLVKGRAENAMEVIQNAKVLLAPLRFGAGLKGKFIDAMQCGTPSVTTAIGAEGMHEDLPWSGAIAEKHAAFAKAAIELYTQKETWLTAQDNGVKIINTQFQKDTYAESLIAGLQSLSNDLSQHRSHNFTGQMLLHHSMKSTLFMSKWIEAKNAKR
ncbi:MAG: glycosyltransferase involved in cell wall biosynthesis [Vicingaceae bacterium]|jgi:glycosyltransferase involved in cell wall biosynthesis